MPAGSLKRPMSSLEDAVPQLPRKARNTAWKKVVKKIKVTPDTRLEVSTRHLVVN
jgi:hypothetical protein